MATSNPYGTGKYKTNVGRAISKKWKDLRQVNYEGSDWGDDEEFDEPQPVSADNPRHPAWGGQPNMYPPNRSFTNPSPPRAGQRPSFDRGDERRYVSSSAGFESAYPTTQRSPFPEPRHDDELSAPNYGMQAPLRLNTQAQGPMPPGGFRPSSRGRQYPAYDDVPFSAPGSFPQQNLSGYGRPPFSDVYQRRESPMRPDSRSSNASHRQFPPRKTSMSQLPPQPDFIQRSDSPARSASPGPGNSTVADDRPPPVFIRPSDIYKRMPEEMEKVRRSQESSRPSIDSGSNPAREGSIGGRSTSSDPKEHTGAVQMAVDDADSTRRLKPTLDTVPERKSEYGFENLIKTSSDDNKPSQETKTEMASVGVSRHDTNASSVYTDRPDPVSASTISRSESISEGLSEADHRLPNAKESFGLPLVHRMSGFDVDLGELGKSAPETTPKAPQPSGNVLPQETSSNRALDDGGNDPKRQGLHHQPTLGYRSVVQQAFDQSENQAPFSPTSTTGTVDRSNSASTTGISPIIGRRYDPTPTPSAIQTAPATIPEESIHSESRPTSTSTLKPGTVEPIQDEALSPPPPIRSGYRRDVTPPSRDNSPAKKPREIGPQALPQPQHVSLVDDETKESIAEEPARGRELGDKPLPKEPKEEAVSADKPNPVPLSRSGTPSTSPIDHPTATPESGPVRSPLTIPTTRPPPSSDGPGRPAPQTRLESFRPSIPGGWQSYTSSAGSATPGTSTPLQSQRNISLPQPPITQNRGDSSESIPTARAPINMTSDGDGVSRKAFAAAASAGSALAGALAGHRLTEQAQDSGESSGAESPNEWDESSSSSDEAEPAPATSDTAPEGRGNKPMAEEKPENLETRANPGSVTSPVRPPSVASSAPSSTNASAEAGKSRENVDYIPAPLRTSRLIDTLGPRPPIPSVSVPQDTPTESDNERLQQEIVKSLTPKSSNLEGQAPEGSSLSDTAPRGTTHPTVAEAELESKKPAPLQVITPRSMEATMVSNDGRSTDSDPPRVEPTTVPSQPSTSIPQGLAISSSVGADVASTGQTEPPVEQRLPTAGKPFLQQRFSWETSSSQPPSASTPKQMSPPSTSSPDTIVPQMPRASSSVEKAQTDDEVIQPIARQASVSSDRPVQEEPASRIPTTTSSEVPQSPQQPLDGPPTFRTIMNLSSPAERIKAFNEGRQFYATSNEQLGNWLLSMKTPENSELFATNGRLSLDTVENTPTHKPSPRRMLTESAGHMQEDGKRLMAAAGRFGGKAGTAAKGLFAKGKEKMRHASSGEKGTPSSRRKSTGPLPDEPEDLVSPSQPRDSTALDRAPQIPLNITPASPIDWFSNSELKRSQTSDLDRMLQPETSASSAAPASQAGTLPQPEHVKMLPGGGNTSSDAPRVPVLAPSPAVSALDSDQAHDEDGGMPSRSISQLTRPPDQSPIEPPHGVVERSNSQRDSSAAQHQVIATQSRGLDPNALAAPKPLTEHQEGSASDAHSSDRSLQVPQLRRRSVISDVSSASPSPGPGAEQRYARRSVSLSPADEVSADVIPAPFGEQITQSENLSQSTAAEAARNRQSLDTEERGPTEPPTAAAPLPVMQDELSNAQDSKPRGEDIEPHSQVEPLTQQPSLQNEQDRGNYSSRHHRPFSFAGIEGIGAVHQAEQMQEPDLSRIPSQPMSPISQGPSSAGLSKEMSQVSVEEATDQANAPGQRHSRSYSRPFGVDPSVGNHPAMRAPEPEQPPMDRAQMYSTESPLPSARRPQEELDRIRQQKGQPQIAVMHQHQPSADEEYRIPGPYVQEYRSPKQISAPRSGRSNVQVLASGGPLPSALRSQQYSSQISPQPHPGPTSNVPVERPNRQSYQEQSSYKTGSAAHVEYDMRSGEFATHPGVQSVQQQYQSMNPPPAPAAQPEYLQPAMPEQQTERKKSMLGKLFGVGSQSRSKLQKQGRVGSPVDNAEVRQKEKRGSFLRRNDSVSSEQSGRQDQLGQLPSSNIQSHSAKRLSRDVLRAPTPEPSERTSEGKKKRFSGFGGNLFKSSTNARASTAPTPSSQTQTHGQHGITQRVISPEPRSAQSQRVMSPEPYSAQTPYGQYPVGPGGYFHQGPGQSQYPQSTYPSSQTQTLPSQYAKVPSPYQHQSEPAGYPYPGQTPQSPPPGPQQAVGSYASTAYPYMNPNQSRPSDLRIDTSSGNRNQYYAPATAPAQGYSRPTSFASAPYNPTPSPGMANRAGPASAPLGQPTPPTQQDPRTHVIDLHKRSRSPRLGRPGSDDLDSNQPRGIPNISANATLGTFSSKKISPVGGIARPDDDQERPFAITVPGLEDDVNERRKKQLLRERIEGGTARSETPVSVESGGQPEHATASTGHGLERNVSVLEGSNNPVSPREARRSSARDKTTPGIIAELPGSKAEGYESEEEIPMSATAYPGQEWMPVYVADD